MVNERTTLPNLTERGTMVVDLLVRYGLLIGTVLQALLPGLGADAARKCLDRLVSEGWLNKHHFPSGPSYYVLSDSACYRLGLKRNGRALRQRPLVRRALVLLFFSDHSHLRLLTSGECREHLPALYRRGAANLYFIDSHDGSLGWLCIDDGKTPQRVRTKVAHTAGVKRTIAELRELSQLQKFRLVILTTTDTKANKLRALFADRPLRETIVEVVAVPACTELVLCN